MPEHAGRDYIQLAYDWLHDMKRPWYDSGQHEAGDTTVRRLAELLEKVAAEAATEVNHEKG